MSSTALVCVVCGETSSSFFIVLGPHAICSECKDKKGTKKIPQFQKPPTFVRYICETHHCGTYNVNLMMFKHIMKDCIIKEQETLGIIRPATFGGYNGDISRKFFLGLNEMDRLITNLANYKRFVIIRFKLDNARFTNNKRSYTGVKYYNKHLRFIVDEEYIDHHRCDELFKRLKFNLDLYIQSLPKRFYKPVLSQEARSNLYYKTLMGNIEKQIIAK